MPSNSPSGRPGPRPFSVSVRRGPALILVTVLGVLLAPVPGSARAGDEPIDVQVLSITDLHGYLSPTEKQTISGPDGQTLQVGGAAYIKAHLDQLRAGHPNSFLIGSGDQFSGWPDYTQGFANEPTIEVLNAFGLDFDVAGNHEFDREFPFLERMMSGDCYGLKGFDSCFPDSSGKLFHGADYDYHAANVVDRATHEQPLAPTWVADVTGPDGTTVPIGFIGLALPGTGEEALSVTAGGFEIQELVDAADRAAADLKDRGVETIVVSAHEGGQQQSHFNACTNPTGPLIEAARTISSDVDVILGGHWHTAFNCMIPDPDGDPRPVLEAANHGKLIGEVILSIDPATGDVMRAETTATNHAMTKDVTPDAAITSIVDYWMDRWDKRKRTPLTTITDDLDYADDRESAMANLAADLYLKEAQPDEQGGADLALVPTDIPSDVVGFGLSYDAAADPRDHPGRVLFGEAWPVVGISPITTLAVSGATLDMILEEQWLPPAYGCQRSAVLAVSSNVRYTYDLGKVVGERVDPAQVMINGEPLDLDANYRVATSSVMAVNGADRGYPSFQQYDELVRARRMGQEVFLNYLRTHRRIDSPGVGRVTAVPGTPPPAEGPFGPLTLLPQSEMSATATSQGNAANGAAGAIDGNCSTMWHSAWTPYAPLPQSITLDLGESRAVEALVYTPRIDASPNGRIASYEVQVSDDGTTFETVTTGTWDQTVDPKIARLPEGTEARHIRLVGLEGGADYAAATEINIALADGA